MNVDPARTREVITAIEPVADRPDRSRIDLSDGRWFEVEHSHPDRSALRPGLDAEEPVVASLLRDHQRREIRSKALDLLGRRDHLSSEIRRRLEDEPSDLVDAEIHALLEDGWLDDLAVARRRVDRWRTEGRSEQDCRHRLESAGMGSPEIEQALSPEVDEETPSDVASLRTLVQREGTRIDELDRADIRRLAARWARRGFELDTIRAVLRECGGLDSALDPSGEDIPSEDDL